MYTIYKAKVMNEKQEMISAKNLVWERTPYIFNDYDEAYQQKVNMQQIDDFNYYTIREF
jgi:hypothetical protein